MIPQAIEPRISQKRLPLYRTHLKVNAREAISLMTPNVPERKREARTEVKPADCVYR